MIERLYVNNFRCLENFSLDLKGRPSALIIGKNGSGKSTLRHALGVFQSICRGSGRVRNLIAESDFTQQRKEIPIRFEIELTLAGKRFKYAISFEIPENLREARIAEESLSVEGDVIFSRQQDLVTFPRGVKFQLDWQVAVLPLISERPGEGSIQLIKSFFASMILIAPIPANMSGFSEEESFELQHDASNFSSWFNSLFSRYPAVYKVLETYLKSFLHDFATFENVPRGERGKQLSVLFENGESSSGMSIDFKHLSDGEKCFFLSALIVSRSVACSLPNRTLPSITDIVVSSVSFPGATARTNSVPSTPATAPRVMTRMRPGSSRWKKETMPRNKCSPHCAPAESGGNISSSVKAPKDTTLRSDQRSVIRLFAPVRNRSDGRRIWLVRTGIQVVAVAAATSAVP